MKTGATTISQAEAFGIASSASPTLLTEKLGCLSCEGNELKAPFGELVVTRRRQMAARADCGRKSSKMRRLAEEGGTLPLDGVLRLNLGPS